MTRAAPPRRAAAAVRLTLAAILLATGAAKLLDLTGFARLLDAYAVFSESALLPAAATVAAAELLLGGWLLAGRATGRASLPSFLLHLGYAAWEGAALGRGLSIANCGCFGVFLPRPLAASTVAEDLALASLSLVLRLLVSRPERRLATLLPMLAVIPQGLPFAPWFSERGVSVEIARLGADAPWIRGTAELPADAARVREALLEFEQYPRIFSPAVARAEVLERAGSSARVHLVWPYPFPLRDRDAVVRYRWEDLPGGGFRLSWDSDSRSGDPRKGVRIAQVAGETDVEPLGSGRCRVAYTFLGELGGKFPARAVDRAHRAEPVHYVRALRRKLGVTDGPVGRSIDTPASGTPPRSDAISDV